MRERSPSIVPYCHCYIYSNNISEGNCTDMWVISLDGLDYLTSERWMPPIILERPNSTNIISSLGKTRSAIFVDLRISFTKITLKQTIHVLWHIANKKQKAREEVILTWFSEVEISYWKQEPNSLFRNVWGLII